MKIDDLNKYRLAIVDEDGNLFSFERKIGQMHQDCILEYTKSKNIQTTNIETLVKSGHCLFYNLNNKNFATFLPNELNIMQQYTLEYLTNYMQNISEMQVVYENGDSVDLENNISNKFSSIALEKYYNKKEELRSK